MYRHTLAHWISLYDFAPSVIISDLHPGYFSAEYAQELAAKFDIDTVEVQHHEAHFAAVLAENELLYKDEKILGVIWDGTGLGHDGEIWGGEFFTYENNAMQRCGHLEYFPAILGDKMALEPRISALCASADVRQARSIISDKFTETERHLYGLMIDSTSLFTSSIGRLFDAVASLLGFSDKQTYEGEAAMFLEAMAESYVAKNGFKMEASYIDALSANRIPVSSMIQGIVSDIEAGKSKALIAAKFHYSLVASIGLIAEKENARKICFSGGVFQNALLVDWISDRYKDQYQLYFHKNLSPNDESVSFGQMVYYDNGIRSVRETAISSAEAQQQTTCA